MNVVDLPVSILLVAAIYLLSIYGLLVMAQVLKEGKNSLIQESKEGENQIKIP